MALLRNDALRNNPRIRRKPVTDSEWSDFVRELDRSSVTSDGGGFDEIKTFTPTWSGFSADPSSDLYYTIANGRLALIWYEGGSFGTSDAADFDITGLPSALTPSNTRQVICSAIDNGVMVSARANIAGTAINLYISDVPATSGPVQYPLSDNWTPSGSKGVIGPIIYVL